MNIRIKKAVFLKSSTKVSEYPNQPYPEFAFFGRSNVGKSSLINMLVNRKDLVKTGAKPGVTRTINFFVLNDSISLVDLPGFGYAKLPAEISRSFAPMMKAYIENRKSLKAAFLLIDIRRIPDEFEHVLLELLIKNEIPVAITLTKCDKLSTNAKKKQVRLIGDALGVDADSMFLTCAKTGEGKRELLKIIGNHTEIKAQHEQ